MEISKNHSNKIELFVKKEDSLELYEFNTNDSAKIVFFDLITNDKILEKDIEINTQESKIEIVLSPDETNNFPVRYGEIEDGKPYIPSMKANVNISGNDPFRIVIERVVVSNG